MRSWNWPLAYADLIARLGEYAAHGRWTLCGMAACVDAMLSVHDAIPVLTASPDPSARNLGEILMRRASAGIGGEIRVHWEEGPAWIDAALTPIKALGGTGPHAARVLTLLGAPALLALGHRDPELMGCIDGAIWLAQDGQPTRARDITPRGAPRTKIYIFEFTAGRPVGDTVAPRSSRIIVRFSDPDIENDPDFESLSTKLGERAGAGVLSGFNACGNRTLDPALVRGRALALRWRAADVLVVHQEMAGFDTPDLRDRTLDGLRDTYTSLGLSQSEYAAMVPGSAPETQTIIATAERLGVERLCIHSDTWTMAATRNNPAQERVALMMGCLLASTRAALGRPARPVEIHPDAIFETPPEESRHGAWNIVSCAAPYLARPATTLGLGDTFMAGCLLVLGQPHRPAADQGPPRDEI